MAYRSGQELPASISALREAGVAEVVVVDHGDDGSAAVAEGLGARTLSDPGNPGFGSGQNRGVAQTTGEFLLLVNPDAVVDPVGIRAGLEVLRVEPRVAAAQGVITNRRTGQAERSAGRALGPAHLLGRALGAGRLLRYRVVGRVVARIPLFADHADRVPRGVTDVEALAATALLVRRSAFESVGGFDTGYFLYGEDLDLCRRLRQAGWRLVAVPIPWADHTSGGSSANWWEREVVWWEGTLRYGALWWSGPAWITAQLATIVRMVPMITARPRRAGELFRRLISGPNHARRRRPSRSVP